ncbi:hypothetical protein SME17J_47520 (plasmid) [Serratia marcescens]|nr:hypothetical protein SME17J_47520 [Serratia marcescens]
MKMLFFDEQIISIFRTLKLEFLLVSSAVSTPYFLRHLLHLA